MEKILRLALQNCTPRIEAIMDVINATPNPSIAAEILLGIYEPVSVNSKSDKLDIRYHNPQFVSYNPVSEKVMFTYDEVETKQGWFLNSQTEFTMENCVVTGWNSENAFRDYRLKSDCPDFTSLADFKANLTSREFIVKKTGRELFSETSLRNWQ